ncbi:uncharacterized protein A1O5_02237 [Cladophialophora psammophila CBS 110553]|uniref:NmrA-like domain-containing protein n=1 Tax=Cladophialophora psammophila CBS 110553 TaxID=1182543 RepID=W9X198_9EURO|nr:uncharacterized protein A1O5_02237 [Cladophialophora psammophila CBS 110553]EXJ73943.1 hypothetical protein A1O5_02237 [Cladophialophora psammophila CBS 110553]
MLYAGHAGTRPACWLQQDGNGEYALNLPFTPNTKVPLLDPGNGIGILVAAILLDPQETLNRQINGWSGYFLVSRLSEDFEAATTQKVQLNTLPMDTWASLGELKGNFQLVIPPAYYICELADAVDKRLNLVAQSGLRKLLSWKDYAAEQFKA